MPTFTIDGKDYDVDSLSDDSKAQLIHIQYCDQQIAELDLKQAMVKTARHAYARALSGLLPE
jgi:hypothetical protein